MASQTFFRMPTFQAAIVRFQVAQERCDSAALMMSLRDMTRFFFTPSLSVDEHHLLVGIYGYHRDLAGPWVKLHTPDWEEILRDMGADGNDLRAVTYVSLTRNALSTEGRLYWRTSGRSLHSDLLVNFAEVRDTPRGRAASWRYAFFTVPPSFLPGEKKILLITDRESAGDNIFEVSSDGDNIWGSAARSFLPLLVIHEEERTDFFFLKDESSWKQKLSSIKATVTLHNLDQVVIMLGHRDVKAMMGLMWSDVDISKGFHSRLIELQKCCGVKVLFGGVPVMGDELTRKVILLVNSFFWERTVELRDNQVYFLDCCSPSLLASPEDIYRDNGMLRSAFKAACLFGLSRLVTMTFGNLITPVPTVMVTVEEMHLFRAWNVMRDRFE